MANYIPINIRSGKLLDKLGFQKEGLAKSYLKIARSWQDHVLTSRINPS
jgi:ribosomal-protein-alanine N-acetyltransferase